jgi:predicted nuclease with TOPRIM domain
MRELEQIKELIEELEKKVQELEQENLALRKSIIAACGSLMNTNKNMESTIEHNSNLNTKFVQPQWVKKKK